MQSGWIDCPTDVAEVLRSIDQLVAIRHSQHNVGMPELNEVIQCRLDIGAFCVNRRGARGPIGVLNV
jgi:hypothetical protein